MKKRNCLDRVMSLLVAAALVCGLVSPALAASDPGSGQGTGSPGSIVGKAYSDDETKYEIYPVPHSETYPAEATAFTMTADVNVVVGAGVDEYTTAFLEEILDRFDRTRTISAAPVADKTNIVLAVHGASDSVRPTKYTDLFTAENKYYDPYILTADATSNTNGIITIVGKDTDCVYYGVATLQMMFTSFNGEKFLPVTIEDYSETIFRGFVEGFYGGFDYEERESQIRSLRDFKGNMYVFASKTDPYHGSNCLALYPTGEGSELPKIEKLVEAGKESKVNYTWSMHIGKGRALGNKGETISDAVYAERLAAAQKKFQQLYDIGVRSFQILNDDYNSGTYTRQVQFLNDMNDWVKGKDDCMPLIYCCAGYNNYWGRTGEETLALAALDSDIYLYWTGTDVNSPIDDTGVNFPYTNSHHDVVTWLNYPCSEHAKSGLFLGDITHYVGGNFNDALAPQKGLISNPIDASEPNKVAYFQLLSWAWNRKGNATTQEKYDQYLQDMWESSFKYLQPEVYESYLTLGRNIANCPDSGRVSAGFPESEYIKEKLEAVQAAITAGNDISANADAIALLKELADIQAAIADVWENCENAALVRQLEPFLKSLESVATAAAEGIKAARALAQTDKDTSAAWDAFAAGSLALGQWDKNHPVNEGDGYAAAWAKAGSKRLQPFADAVLNHVREAMAETFNPDGGFGEPTFYAKIHGTVRGDDDQSAKMFDGRTGTFAAYESGNQQVDDYYGVDLGRTELVKAVDILQGSSDTDHDYFHNAELEYSLDGENWVTLAKKVNSHHIRVDGLEIAARYVRLRLTERGYGGKADYWTHVREFTVTTEEADSLYTNVDPAPTANVREEGSSYVLAVTSATLAQNEYVGIRLPEITGINDIDIDGTLPTGVKVEYSVSGVNWTEGSPSTNTAMGYVRLVNEGSDSVTLSNVTLTASHPATLNLQYVASAAGMPLSGGTSWANMVDGNRATRTYVGVRQAYGQYVIFDLGGVIPVHDVSLYLPETGNDVPHNLDVFLGDSPDPNGTWTEIFSPSGGQLRGDLSYAMDMPYRKFTWTGEDQSGNGQNARYIKLAIADIEAFNWYYMNELEINATVTEEEAAPLGAVTASSGFAQNGGDGNLLTFYTPADNEAGGAGWWQKLFQEPVTATKVTVLRGAGGANAKAYIQYSERSWEELGALEESATTFELTGDKAQAVTGVKVAWEAGDAPSIAEVVIAQERSVTGTDVPALPSIYEKPADPTGTVEVDNGTEAANVGLPSMVNAVTSAGETVEVPVVWTCESYSATTAGSYTFTGMLDAAAVGLANPGCFALTATVAVLPAPGNPGAPENLVTSTSGVWASGQETSGTSPEHALVADDNWSGNKMKEKNNSAEYSTITDAVNWITVDLGENVEDITEIAIEYNMKAWPLTYAVQIGDSNISYANYTTPVDNATTLSASYTGDSAMHAMNAAGWTTIYSGKKTAGTSTAVGDVILKANFSKPIPRGARYLRLYFTDINPKALAATGIGVKQITVTGTRGSGQTVNKPNVFSVASSTASGTVGTAFGSLNLPATVTATLSDRTTASLGVTWSDEGYNASSTAAQTITGTLTLPSDGSVTNTNNVKASLTLTLTTAPTVESVQFTPASLSVAYGTAFADLGLPTQGTATLSDGTTVDGTIDWTESDYDATQTDEQTINGTFTGGGKTARVTITVTVGAQRETRYTVTFDSQGGSAVASQSVAENGKATEPAKPTKDNAEFGGWYRDKNCTDDHKYDFDTLVTGDITLYAKWNEVIAANYTVAFDSQGGSAVASQSVAENGKATEPAKPTKNGYTFGGWYKDKNCTDDHKYDFDTAVTENITLYAKWTAAQQSSGGGSVIVSPIPSGDTTPTTPTTTTNPDGSTTTTVTDKETGTVTETTEKEDGTVEIKETQKDGTVTETTEKPDGSTEVVETKPDGTVTETTKNTDGSTEMVETKPDGTVTETTKNTDGSTEVVETKPDGTITATATDPEGGKVEKVTDPEKNVAITVTDPEGEVLAQVELPAEVPELETRFEDVPEGHWADQAIHSMAAMEVVKGVGDDRFDMDGDMTRGALATVLSRLSNGQEGLESTFADVPSDEWYADGIAWAARTGIVTGYSETEFGPNDIITREQLAVMLCRYARLLGMDTTADSAALDSFGDNSSIHGWATDSIAWCVANGILRGMGDETLAPTATATRAQVAVMLQRFMDLMK